MSSAMLSPPATDFPKSNIRRKPVTTYKSPSAHDIDPLITLSARNNASSTSAHPLSGRHNILQHVQTSAQPSQKKARARSQALPLYHPLGELALSLPPLNPADFGLPLPRLLDETSRRSSAHSRRGSAKPPDAEEEDISIPTVSSIAAVAANEVKRVSPRKRRGGVGSVKRRRRDGDDGDATYPAKRTRQPRGGGGDDNEFDDAQGQGDGDGTPEVDGPERRPERRTTRSRTKRRDSSEIESLDEHPVHDSLSVSEENGKQTVLEGISERDKEEREERV